MSPHLREINKERLRLRALLDRVRQLNKSIRLVDRIMGQ